MHKNLRAFFLGDHGQEVIDRSKMSKQVCFSARIGVTPPTAAVDGVTIDAAIIDALNNLNAFDKCLAGPESLESPIGEG